MRFDEFGNALYTTAEIQKMYGMSNKGLFYYEDKEIINPRRVQSNNYRVYTLRETARLHRCRVFRQCGFPVNEIVGFVSHCSGPELASGFDQRLASIDEEITWLDMVKKEIQRTSASIRSICEDGIPFEIIMRPPMFRMTLRSIDKAYTEQSQILYQSWQAFIPLAGASLRIDRKQLEEDVAKAPVELGYALLAEHVCVLSDDLTSELQYLPPVKCLHTIIHGDEDQLGNIQRFKDGLKWLKENHMELVGDPVTRMIATFDSGNGMERFDHAWFPVN